jgi:hypothetical protein
MGPNNTKNSSKSVISSYSTLNNIVRSFDQDTVPLLCVETKRVGPINSKHNNSNEETFLQASAL